MRPKVYSTGCPWCGVTVEGPYYTVSSDPSGQFERRAHNDCYKNAYQEGGELFKQTTESSRTETFAHPLSKELQIVREYKNDKISNQFVKIGHGQNAQYVHDGPALANTIETLLEAQRLFRGDK